MPIVTIDKSTLTIQIPKYSEARPLNFAGDSRGTAVADGVIGAAGASPGPATNWPQEVQNRACSGSFVPQAEQKDGVMAQSIRGIFEGRVP
jgi:hypothetical protein